MSEHKWHNRFLQLACHVAQWSKDPSTRCGAVIVRPNKTIAGIGYNGFPRGINDASASYTDKSIKYAYIVHAEVNAILNCAERLDGYTLYTYPSSVGPTCDRCAALVIQAGIRKVVSYEGSTKVDWLDSVQRARDLYRDAQVEVLEI